MTTVEVPVPANVVGAAVLDMRRWLDMRADRRGQSPPVRSARDSWAVAIVAQFSRTICSYGEGPYARGRPRRLRYLASRATHD
jgi:hypothetical protein